MFLQRFSFCTAWLAVSFLIVLPLFHPGTVADAGTLSVGKKVIYPGGADQPPKEKDTGVKLNAEARGGGNPDESAEAGDLPTEPEAKQDRWEGMLSEGKSDQVYREALKDSSPVGLAYRAISLAKEGRSSEAGKLAEKILADRTIPEDLQFQLEEILEDAPQE